VITDLGVLEPDGDTRELVLVAVHPGVDVAHVQEQTGWPLRVADELATTTPPDDTELRVLRDLQARTEEAHRAGT
jgi:glutaconate CoA-transferase, subunit B